jgi:hypothetical protein
MFDVDIRVNVAKDSQKFIREMFNYVITTYSLHPNEWESKRSN